MAIILSRGLLRDIDDCHDYDDYEARVKPRLAALEHVSTGACPGCEDCGLSAEPTDDEYEGASESYFSWRDCPICTRAQGGDRYPMHWVDVSDQTIQHGECCSDCMYYIEYGRLDDETMERVNDSRAVESLADELDRA